MTVTRGYLNQITIPLGDGVANVNEVGGNRGTWPAERPGHVAAHEAGHLMGLDDQYRENLANFGWEGNIMGSFDGVVEERNIKMILDANKTQESASCGCK